MIRKLLLSLSGKNRKAYKLGNKEKSMAKRRLRQFTADRWKSELESEAFLSGLDAVVKFMSETGVEAGFQLAYCPTADMLAYDNLEILVGSEKRLNLFVPMNQESARLWIEEKTGQKIISGCYLGIENDNGLSQFNDWLERYNQENSSKRVSIDFPQSEDHDRRVDAYLNFLEKEEEDDICLAYAIMVHTHPSKEILNGDFSPSPNDLRYLNSIRNANSFVGSAFNPIELILMVGTSFRGSENKFRSPFIILQERTKEPLPETTDWDTMSREIWNLTSPIGGLLTSLFWLKQSRHPAEEAIRNYNLVMGIYAPHKQIRIVSGKLSDLSAYRHTIKSKPSEFRNLYID